MKITKKYINKNTELILLKNNPLSGYKFLHNGECYSHKMFGFVYKNEKVISYDKPQTKKEFINIIHRHLNSQFKQVYGHPAKPDFKI